MTAKEMFEELGYRYFRNGSRITYETKKCRMIEFDLKNKQVYLTDDTNEVIELSLEELEAIKKQIEELGWNNVSKL